MHARPQAVQALLSKLEKHLGAAKFGSTALVFLGDYVGAFLVASCVG